MSKNNYTNYNKYAEQKPADEPEVVEEVIEEPVVEEVVEEPVVTEEPVERIGIVANCAKLNVRRSPYPNGEVVCIIEAGEAVMVNDSTSTEQFYAVTTNDGKEGFCMKEFIEV